MVRDGFITAVEVVDNSADQRSDDDVLLPGLIDLQVNGYGGIDFNAADLTAADVRTVVESLWAVGVTGFCPTVITGPTDRMLASMRAITEACAQDDDVADAVLGIHLEGPWICPDDGARGAHPRDAVRAPDLAELRALTDGGDVAIMTMAPELPGAADLIATAAAAGVAVSIGHSAGTPDDVRMAAATGATLSTHLGNGVPLTLPRHPNLIWQQLFDDRLVCMLIADSFHLDVGTLTAMTRAKGTGRWLLVSDVTSIGGLSPGRYQTPIGGLVELDAAGRLGVVGAEHLAGAARSLLDGLAWLLSEGTIPAADVAAAVSSVPATALARRGKHRGDIAPGNRADLVRARWKSGHQLAVLETISQGRTVWQAGG